MISFCPHCNQKYTMHRSQDGKIVECSSCKRNFKVERAVAITSFCSNCKSKYILNSSQIGCALECPTCKKTFKVESAVTVTNICPHCKQKNIIYNFQIGQMVKCSYCEKIFKAKAKFTDIWYCIIGIIIAGFIIWGIASCISSCNENHKKREMEGDLIEAKIICEDQITARLRSPSTAKFTFTKKNKQGSEYAFSGFVDSQNSFGAMVRTHFDVKMQYSLGGRYKIETFKLK